MKTGKYQSFYDTKNGCTATLRVEANSDRPYVLRCRTAEGKLFFKFAFSSAQRAKFMLDYLLPPGAESPCNFWTRTGFVGNYD